MQHRHIGGDSPSDTCYGRSAFGRQPSFRTAIVGARARERFGRKQEHAQDSPPHRRRLLLGARRPGRTAGSTRPSSPASWRAGSPASRSTASTSIGSTRAGSSQDTAIIYDAGSTIYVNRPHNGADALNRWDTMVTRLPSTRLCSIDTVTDDRHLDADADGRGLPRRFRALSAGAGRLGRLNAGPPAGIAFGRLTLTCPSAPERPARQREA